jgi:dTDP-4-dehydrorhamnose 3,5-epimerase
MAPRFPALQETGLPGCYELRAFRQEDARGSFVKPFHEPAFRELGLAADWRETFVTTSAAGVLRGMHFQLPPHDHVKLVSCLRGRVLDVVLDLRADSPTYGRCASAVLDARGGDALYVPAGLAHGFLALEDGAELLYQVTRPYAPDHDTGLLWSSIPFDWPEPAPLVSERDRALPSFESFTSPFRSA